MQIIMAGKVCDQGGNQIGHFKRCKVPRIENMYLRLWSLMQIGNRPGNGKNAVAAAPDHFDRYM
jgi:hypothetical protein